MARGAARTAVNALMMGEDTVIVIALLILSIGNVQVAATEKLLVSDYAKG